MGIAVCYLRVVDPRRMLSRRMRLAHGFNNRTALGRCGTIALLVSTENRAAMAVRNRPRATLVKEDPTDAHEERNMWNQIVTDIKKLKQINAKAAEISAQIVDVEKNLGPCKSYWSFLLSNSNVQRIASCLFYFHIRQSYYASSSSR